MAISQDGTTAEHAFAEHEHRDLARGLDRIHAIARAVGGPSSVDWSGAVLSVLDWVERVLRPHAAWEDAWLYPEIASRAGSPWATKLMTFEHQQILEIARKVELDRERLSGEQLFRDEMVGLAGDLFVLEGLLRAHIEREARFLIPLLEMAVGETATSGPSQ
jgi:hemerythrin-like domain-containing protein